MYLSEYRRILFHQGFRTCIQGLDQIMAELQTVKRPFTKISSRPESAGMLQRFALAYAGMVVQNTQPIAIAEMVGFLLIVSDGSLDFFSSNHLACVIHILDGAVTDILATANNAACIYGSTHRASVEHIHNINMAFLS